MCDSCVVTLISVFVNWKISLCFRWCFHVFCFQNVVSLSPLTLVGRWFSSHHIFQAPKKTTNTLHSLSPHPRTEIEDTIKTHVCKSHGFKQTIGVHFFRGYIYTFLHFHGIPSSRSFASKPPLQSWLRYTARAALGVVSSLGVVQWVVDLKKTVGFLVLFTLRKFRPPQN